MHQLGCAKRAIEAFCYLLGGKVTDEYGPTSGNKIKRINDALEIIHSLCQNYGGMLSRQSDCDFLKTKFVTAL